MARRKSDFKNTWQYKRILEILDDYWLSQPEEEYVDVDMYFRKKNGEEQRKHIIWRAEPTKKELEKKLAELREIIKQTDDIEEFAEGTRLYQEMLRRYRSMVENNAEGV